MKKAIVVTVSRQLMSKYGKSFEEKNFRRMMQFSEQFLENGIVVALSRQLSWSHILVLLPLKTIEAKLYYAGIVNRDSLGVRDLRKSILNKEFERRTIANLHNASNHPAIHNNFKDPYFLDFLGLKDTYLEKDLEAAILRELEAFILELWKGFHNNSCTKKAAIIF
ncbi:PDDEXK nuclease domain-containing protein [Arachidicoccus sp.]|uniref:PDDEXK nuclease domain-containing protein n=1 Tax=Arachidicoccus sp. TaxID=1872624 RepID=UPI003D2028F9